MEKKKETWKVILKTENYEAEKNPIIISNLNFRDFMKIKSIEQLKEAWPEIYTYFERVKAQAFLPFYKGDKAADMSTVEGWVYAFATNRDYIDFIWQGGKLWVYTDKSASWQEARKHVYYLYRAYLYETNPFFEIAAAMGKDDAFADSLFRFIVDREDTNENRECVRLCFKKKKKLIIYEKLIAKIKDKADIELSFRINDEYFEAMNQKLKA